MRTLTVTICVAAAALAGAAAALGATRAVLPVDSFSAADVATCLSPLPAHVSAWFPIEPEEATFPVAVGIQRLRTTTTFANGDLRRHLVLVTIANANGRSVVDRTTYDVVVHESADVPLASGSYTTVRTSAGRTLLRRTGRLFYDPGDDTTFLAPAAPARLDRTACRLLA